MRTKIITTVLLCIYIFINISCDGNNGTEPQTPGVSDIILELNHYYADSMVVSILVTDPQGIDDIDSVWGWYYYLDEDLSSELALFRDDGLGADTVAGDSRYSVSFLPSGGEFQFGYYTFSARATDMGGNMSMQLDTLFWTLDGNMPLLFDPTGPDSLEKGSTDTSYIFINAYDQDGLDDIDSVYFQVTRPDQTVNPLHFHLHDDGEFGDATQGDGIYTLGIQAPTPASQSGDYTFIFYAFDVLGNPSNNPQLILTAY
jgi:hypothetical protein